VNERGEAKRERRCIPHHEYKPVTSKTISFVKKR
jgi:hypothetical protein